MMDNNTGKLVDVAPIFDYNLALVADIAGKNVLNTLSQMFNTNETIENITKQMLPHSNIQIDSQQLKKTKQYFKEYPQVYKNIMNRIGSI